MTLSYEALKKGYENLYSQMHISEDRYNQALTQAVHLSANKQRYQTVASATGVPWWWIAIVHELESGANFTRHLHNGDPLTARTTHLPKGRPEKGDPPFIWEESAIDALVMQGLNKVKYWPIPRALYEFERYNGFGYTGHKINSPYVWSWSNLYDRGKFASDGVYDPKLVSAQCGAAPLMYCIDVLMDGAHVDMTKLVGDPWYVRLWNWIKELFL